RRRRVRTPPPRPPPRAGRSPPRAASSRRPRRLFGELPLPRLPRDEAQDAPRLRLALALVAVEPDEPEVDERRAARRAVGRLLPLEERAELPAEDVAVGGIEREVDLLDLLAADDAELDAGAERQL